MTNVISINMPSIISSFNTFKKIMQDIYKNDNNTLLHYLNCNNNADNYFNNSSETLEDYDYFIDKINNIKEDLCDKLYYFLNDFINTDKESNNYYLATPYKSKYTLLTKNANIIIHNSISREFFMNFKFITLNFYINSSQYLHPFSNIFSYRPACKLTNQVYIETFEIIKTTNEYEDTGSIIIKTFWLKLIQRTWKKIYKKRIEWIKKNYSIQGLHYREINGRNKYGHIPTIRGMLSHLKN